MRTLGNLIWFVLYGWWLGTISAIIGLLFCLTVIGIPIGIASLQYAKLMYLPFGKEIVRESFIKGPQQNSFIKGTVYTILNIIWLPFGLFLILISIPVIILNAVSIIGIPYAIILARSCKFMLWPVGARVISIEEAQAHRTVNVFAKRGMLPAAGMTSNVNVQSTVIVSQAPTISPEEQERIEAERMRQKEEQQLAREAAIQNAKEKAGAFFDGTKKLINSAVQATAKKAGELADAAKNKPSDVEDTEKKVFCPKCGNEFVGNAKFCSGCGEKKVLREFLE